MTLENDFAGSLMGTTRSLSVRDLRKAKVENVRIVERSQILALLESMQATKPEPGSDATQRRVERLLQENAKLGKEKTEIEHARGLVEADRSRLQAALDEVCQALGREVGEKLQSSDVKELLCERQRLRAQVLSLETNVKRLQSSARKRLDQELARAATLEHERDQLTTLRGTLEQDNSRFEADLEALRADLEQFRDERDRVIDERDAMAVEREGLRKERDGARKERDQFREERDTYLKRCATLGEEAATLRANRDALHNQVTELQHAREADAAELAEYLREKESLLAQIAELTPPEPEPEPEPEVIAAPEPEPKTQTRNIRHTYQESPPRRKPSKPGQAGFGFGFGFSGR